MKKDFVCQQDFDHKIWGIGDPCRKKREMFVETSYYQFWERQPDIQIAVNLSIRNR